MGYDRSGYDFVYYTYEMVNLCYIRKFHFIIHGYLVGNLFVRATNINYIRLSHYTPAKGFIVVPVPISYVVRSVPENVF